LINNYFSAGGDISCF